MLAVDALARRDAFGTNLGPQNEVFALLFSRFAETAGDQVAIATSNGFAAAAGDCFVEETVVAALAAVSVVVSSGCVVVVVGLGRWVFGNSYCILCTVHIGTVTNFHIINTRSCSFFCCGSIYVAAAAAPTLALTTRDVPACVGSFAYPIAVVSRTSWGTIATAAAAVVVTAITTAAGVVVVAARAVAVGDVVDSFT